MKMQITKESRCQTPLTGQLSKSLIQENISKPSELVFACAWCPDWTYQKLKEYQQYTHGMCRKHKDEFIIQIKQRVVRVNQVSV